MEMSATCCLCSRKPNCNLLVSMMLLLLSSRFKDQRHAACACPKKDKTPAKLTWKSSGQHASSTRQDATGVRCPPARLPLQRVQMSLAFPQATLRWKAAS